MSAPPLLSLQLSARYSAGAAVLRNIRLEMQQGEILGLVGQTGSGKSTLALAILRLLHLKGGKAEGSILFKGRDLIRIPEREMFALRGKEIALVLQSPISALNPALRVGTQLEEAWKIHCPSPREDCTRAISEALANVSLPSDGAILRKYPERLSVGQAQRVLIAMAILHRPSLLIADEPTSALDVITQSEILGLFRRLSESLGIGVLLISHDLLSISTIATRVAVMADGEIVECRDKDELFSQPSHPYTKKLLAALPIGNSLGRAPDSQLMTSDRRESHPSMQEERIGPRTVSLS